MIDRVHGHTTGLGPRVPLDREFMLRPARLEQRLVRPATTGHNTDHAPHAALDHLLRARRKLDAGLALVRVVANDGDVVTRRPAQRTPVADLLLHVADHRTLGHAAEREHVADVQGRILAGVDELAGVHALVGDEGLGVQLEAVRVAEDDLGEGRAAAGVVDDVLHDPADVAMALGVVVGPELRGGLVQAGVCGEDAAATFTLVADDTTLCGGLAVMSGWLCSVIHFSRA